MWSLSVKILNPYEALAKECQNREKSDKRKGVRTMARNSKQLRNMCSIALGIALYVALSMTAKIPVIGHASLDLGYIVFAVYCYYYGSITGMAVGSVGCMLVSLLTSGWFPPGWIVGNMIIGFIVGMVGKSSGYSTPKRIAVVFIAVFLGIFCAKTVIECALYSIPLTVKVPKSAVVFAMDAVVMSIGTWLAPKIPVTVVK